jgi:hypothetical protein
MTYQIDLQEREAAEQAAAKERKNSEVWEVVLRTLPLDRPGEAHFRMLLDYCQGELTLEKVTRFFLNPPRGWTLPLVSMNKAREQLIDEICELLEDPTQRRMSAYDLRQARIRYQSTYSLGQLRARLVELLLKQAWAKKSPDEIRVELAAIRAAESNVWTNPADGRVFERLPATIDGLAAGEFLRWAARHSFDHFKNLTARFGAPQITAAMNSRS